MKNLLKTIITVLSILNLNILLIAQNGIDGYFEEQGGVLCIEAESYFAKFDRIPTDGSQKLEHAWTLETKNTGFSGNGHMSNLPDEQCESCSEHNSPKDGSGAEMVYKVKINTAGTYAVWIRGWSLGGESNGMHIQVDGNFVMNSAGTNMSGFRPNNSWQWEHASKDYAAAANLTLTAGMHTIHVYGRDDGFSIDKILLEIGRSSAPSGMGPEQSTFVPSANSDFKTLNVINGSGDGVYEEGKIISIRADKPVEGQIFDQWTGDVAGVQDVFASPTTITMPSKEVNITATYKKEVLPMHTVTFTITDGHNPIEGAKVRTLTEYQVTNEKGEVVFNDVLEREGLEYIISANGYITFTIEVDVLTDVNESVQLVSASTVVDGNDFGISLFPNPAEQSFTLTNISNVSRIQIINIQGQVLTELWPNSQNVLHYNVSDYPIGFYSVVLQIENNTISIPFFKK